MVALAAVGQLTEPADLTVRLTHLQPQVAAAVATEAMAYLAEVVAVEATAHQLSVMPTEALELADRDLQVVADRPLLQVIQAVAAVVLLALV